MLYQGRLKRSHTRLAGFRGFHGTPGGLRGALGSLKEFIRGLRNASECQGILWKFQWCPGEFQRVSGDVRGYQDDSGAFQSSLMRFQGHVNGVPGGINWFRGSQRRFRWLQASQDALGSLIGVSGGLKGHFRESCVIFQRRCRSLTDALGVSWGLRGVRRIRGC